MASGRPDWFGTIVAAGKYNNTYLPIALDVDGFITATMKGKYDTDSLLKTIAVDSSGIMKANLSVQDLDFLTVRPAYGEAKRVEIAPSIPSSTETSISIKSGRGILYTANFRWSTVNSCITMEPTLKIDGALIVDQAVSVLRLHEFFHPAHHPSFLIKYDEDDHYYIVGFRPGLTFESSIEFKAKHSYPTNVLVYLKYAYALVP